MTTAPMRPEHIPDGLRLCRAAGWNQTARDWTRFLDAPAGARVARMNNRVVGTAATIRYQHAFAWIGMVLVDPVMRGRGIGTRLFSEAVEQLADVGASRLDATPAGRGLYVRQGFTEEYRLHRMTRAAGVAGATPPSGVRPLRVEDVGRAGALDAHAFGADRQLMLRWMLEGAPELAWIADDGGRVGGFALGRHGYGFDHIGPVIADDRDIAVALTAAALTATARPVILDATPHVTDWRSWLESNGFAVARELIRMSRGAPPPADAERQFAILGPEFG